MEICIYNRFSLLHLIDTQIRDEDFASSQCLPPPDTAIPNLLKFALEDLAMMASLLLIRGR
jgi:hypothetical protein